MKNRAKHPDACKHQPEYITWSTVFKPQKCVKCGDIFVYKNPKFLFAATLILCLLVVIVICYGLRMCINHIGGNSLVYIFLTSLLTGLAILFIRYFARKIYTCFGKTTSITMPISKRGGYNADEKKSQ